MWPGECWGRAAWVSEGRLGPESRELEEERRDGGRAWSGSLLPWRWATVAA